LLVLSPFCAALETKHGAPPSVPHVVMEDGSYFHELHRMNPAERELHRASLKSFLEHPSFLFPQVINHDEGYSNHQSELEDEYGRKCTLKYTLEHSEFHVFRSLDDSDAIKVSESENGDTMTVFFPSEELAAKYFSNYTSAMKGSKLLMLTGSAKWGVRRSHRGVEGQVSFIDLSCQCTHSCYTMMTTVCGSLVRASHSL
jgi:hypothetical protein